MLMSRYLAEDFRQRAALGRRRAASCISTPWGTSQGAEVYAEGIAFHTTAGHGGFKLDRVRNAALHPALRVPGGWFEEDCEWAKVAIGFPELFTDREKTSADRMLKDWSPDAWEAVHGRRLLPEESFQRDREHFEREHAGDWVVIAAVRSDRYPGFVETVAIIGGRRELGEQRNFLVANDEYGAGRHGFVIDPTRHRSIAA